MGISTRVYTVYGVQHAGYDSAFTDAIFEPHDMPVEKYVIADGMDGKYIIVGNVLFNSGDARWEPLSGFETIDIDTLPEKKREVEIAFAEHAPEWLSKLDGEWKLMTFVHYS